MTIPEIEAKLKALETPAFMRALNAFNSLKPLNLYTVGQTRSWLTRHVDKDAAVAWKAYNDVENLLP